MVSGHTLRCSRTVWFVVFLLLAGASAFGRGNTRSHPLHPRAAARDLALGPEGSLTVSLVGISGGVPLLDSPGGPALLNCGKVSYGGSTTPKLEVQQHAGSFVVSTDFGLLVQDATKLAHFATVSGALSGAQTAVTYRIDGKKLGSAPVLLISHASVGTLSEHRLEIEVPTGLTEAGADTQIAIQFAVSAE